MARRKSSGPVVDREDSAVVDTEQTENTDVEETEGVEDGEGTVDLTNLSTRDKVLQMAEGGMTRREIADALGIKYQYVQRVLKGNESVERGTSGGGARVVLADGTPRVQRVKELAQEGMKTGDIARQLEVPYQYVYRILQTAGMLNKGEDGQGGGGRARAMVTFEGEERPRIDVIRELAEKGQSRGQIAKALNVPYQIVYQALKNSNIAVAAASNRQASPRNSNRAAEEANSGDDDEFEFEDEGDSSTQSDDFEFDGLSESDE